MNNLFYKTIKSKLTYKKILLFVFFLLVGCAIVLPRSLAVDNQAVKSVVIPSEKLNVENKEAGAWKITESTEWTANDEAKITFNLDTIFRNNLEGVDFIFALDTSSSMNGNKLNELKKSIKEVSDNLLIHSNNRISIISFNSESNLLVDFTNNNNLLNEKVEGLSAVGKTNYYKALTSIEEILKNYQVEKDRSCMVVFITGSFPNEGSPNQDIYFRYLKEEYPSVMFNGIQYDLGDKVIEQIKNISDNQYLVTSDNLGSKLVKILNVSEVYNNFSINEYVDDRYFYVENPSDISVNKGNVSLDKNNQKITWNISNLKSGLGAKMEVIIKLKNEFISQYDLYSVSKRIEINSLIGEDKEEVSNLLTPILSNNYRVIYDGNVPDECRLDNIPDTLHKSPFDVVTITDQVPVCKGYKFKGWKVITKSVKKINDDYFIMPDEDVIIRAEWSKIRIDKTADGEIHRGITLYDQVRLDYENNNYAKLYTGDTSTLAGKQKVYYYYGEASNNNVIFANYCWKIVRTTSTGGVKLLYNGVPDASNKCNNIGDAAHLTASQMNLSTNKVEYNKQYHSPADVGYMYNNETRYQYESSIVTSRPFLMGNSFTYANGTYTLINTISSSINSSTISNLTNYHYTCFDSTGSCTTLYYVFYFSNPNGYYLALTGGKSVENVLNEMLYDNSVNKDSSTIKQAIDYWYGHNMTNFTKHLEDTVWCNDRSIYDLGGWNPNGGSMITDLKFNSSVNLNNLTCRNINDRFTENVENGNGKLNYPVGLITRQEQNLAYSSYSPLDSGNDFWGLSPSCFAEGERAYIYDVVGGGFNSNSHVYYMSGVRPAVSLHTGIEYSEGSGTINEPYIVLTD